MQNQNYGQNKSRTPNAQDKANGPETQNKKKEQAQNKAKDVNKF